jgi:hypothetical protein
MRVKLTATVLAATVALIAFALPPGAAAAKTYKQRASVTAELDGTGTNGFRFFLYSADSGFVVFSTSKDVGEAADTSVNYFEASPNHRSDAADGRLKVKIGKLGHFRGHFVSSSTKTQKPSKFCDGEPTTTEEGHFVGSFEFHGERGYTTIDAHHLSGSLTHIGAQTCKFPAEPEGNWSSGQEKAEEKREAGEFRLLAADSKAHTVFQARREEAPPEFHLMPTSYEMSVEGSKAGRFSVSYSASIFDFGPNAAETFRVPNLAEPLNEAILEPPAPFTGAATFHLDTPKTASWTGDLAVELPGLGTVPLTGQAISAGLCHGRSDCTKTLPRIPQLLLEAGSGGGLIAIAVGTKHSS